MGSTSCKDVSSFLFTATPISLRWRPTGETVAGVGGSSGVASNQFDVTYGMVLDSSNSLYVADYYNNRVQKWWMNTKNGTTIAGQANGASGTNSSYLFRPAGLAIDSIGNIYVAERGNNRVQLYAKTASVGSIIAGITGNYFLV